MITLESLEILIAVGVSLLNIIIVLLISFLVMVLLGLIPAFIAKKKGHNFILWLIYGGLLFPFSLFHSFFIKESTPKKPSILITLIIGLILGISVRYNIHYLSTTDFQLSNLIMVISICISFISYICIWGNNNKGAFISFILLAINILILFGSFIAGVILHPIGFLPSILVLLIIEGSYKSLEKLN